MHLSRSTMKRHFEDDGALHPHRPQKSRCCHSVALSRGSGREVFLPSHPGSISWERGVWPHGFGNMSPHCIRSYSVLKLETEESVYALSCSHAFWIDVHASSRYIHPCIQKWTVHIWSPWLLDHPVWSVGPCWCHMAPTSDIEMVVKRLAYQGALVLFYGA